MPVINGFDVSKTINLPDTVDGWKRRLHINVRGEKVTLVHRWKDRKSDRVHTQRTTLDESQVAKLLAALSVGAAALLGEDDERWAVFQSQVDKGIMGAVVKK